MPYKHNEKNRDKIDKPRYKVSSWPEYNNALRGVAIFAIDFSGHPAQKISKNHATANAFGCPDSSCFARFNPTRG